MNNVVICIGSNTANREEIIADAIKRLTELICNVRQSSVYECESHSGIGAPYINTVISGSTMLSYEQLYSFTKQLEVEMGRTPRSKETGVMPLDIDIVLCNDKIIHPRDYKLYHFRHGYEQII
jgi:2-amino-4-hydroxy-6-hydroxymethyldihydropteridine diphosphokinase